VSTHPSIVQPALLSKINERQVLRTIQARGPLSRAEVARHSGISAPTASKAVESLLRAGLLEEGEAPDAGRGRPARKLGLASRAAQVLGLVIDAEVCRVVSAGFDGKLHEGPPAEFATPGRYEELIDSFVDCAHQIVARTGMATLGMAVSVPGLIDYRHQRGVLSPNVPFTDGHSPSRDLTERLGIECVMVQESHALCLAERYYGEARGIDDFAMLDVSTGVGLGVMSGGRLLTGHSGLAGEIGHVTVEIDGRQCGCGNRGCLETVASDRALAAGISRRLGRRIGVEEAIRLAQDGDAVATAELDLTCRYLAIGLAAAINLFNPSTLFVHGRLFEADGNLFRRLIEETGKRALPPSFADCRIIQARGSKRQGAVAAVIEHLTNSVVPALGNGNHGPLLAVDGFPAAR
jgi:predicted NBD/HSP70 family sugar kinase